MTEWTKLLEQHYSTADTVPMVKVEHDDLYLMQGDDLIVLSVDLFGQYADGVWTAIAEAARLREARA